MKHSSSHHVKLDPTLPTIIIMGTLTQYLMLVWSIESPTFNNIYQFLCENLVPLYLLVLCKRYVYNSLISFVVPIRGIDDKQLCEAQVLLLRSQSTELGSVHYFPFMAIQSNLNPKPNPNQITFKAHNQIKPASQSQSFFDCIWLQFIRLLVFIAWGKSCWIVYPKQLCTVSSMLILAILFSLWGRLYTTKPAEWPDCWWRGGHRHMVLSLVKGRFRGGWTIYNQPLCGSV